MKIVQIVSFGYLGGGAEISVFLLKNCLEARGHEVKIISSDYNNSVDHFSDIEFPAIDGPKRSLFKKTFYHLWYPASYRCIKEAIKQYQPDVIHFHTMGQLSPSAMFAIGATPAILTVHGPEEYVSSIFTWSFSSKLFKAGSVNEHKLTNLGKLHAFFHCYLQRPFYRVGIKHLSALIAPSKYMAKVLTDESYGVKVLQVYNGVELPNKATKSYNDDRLLYVGRLEYIKGVDVLLKAMSQVIDKLPNAKLDIVGDGSIRRELEKYISEHNLKKNVTFYGWQDAKQIHKMYKETTIAVVPSVWPENLPTVCIEALANGRPVVGTNTGGIPELIQNNVTGQVVRPNDHEELAKAIIKWLSQETSARLSELCAKSVSNFDVGIFTTKLESIYEDIYA